jgi:hypothetical protein
MSEYIWLEAQAYALWKFNGCDAYREWSWLSEAEKAHWGNKVLEEIGKIVQKLQKEGTH